MSCTGRIGVRQKMLAIALRVAGKGLPKRLRPGNGETPREFPPKLRPSRGFPSQSESFDSTEIPSETEASAGRPFWVRGVEPLGLVPGLPLRGGHLPLRADVPSGSP